MSAKWHIQHVLRIPARSVHRSILDIDGSPCYTSAWLGIWLVGTFQPHLGGEYGQANTSGLPLSVRASAVEAAARAGLPVGIATQHRCRPCNSRYNDPYTQAAF
jgi:hypothetical protein